MIAVVVPVIFTSAGLNASVVVVILAAVWIFVFLFGGVWLLRWWLQRSDRLPRALNYDVLLVLLPRESLRQEQAERDWKEVLASFETLFVTLGSIQSSGRGHIGRAWESFWFGRHDHLAFEIVAHHGYIHFYLAVPRTIRQLVELQIQAQYPQAHITQVEDYNLFQHQGHIAATVLRLSKPYYFPIRTYKKLDSDPLSAVTNVLSKVPTGDGAAVQLIIRPRRHGWERTGRALARRMQEGEKMGSGGGRKLDILTASFRTSQPADAYRGLPQLTPMDQELIRALEEKSGKPGFDVNIRLVASSTSDAGARVILENMVNTFSQYQALESGNHFRRQGIQTGGQIIRDFIYRHFVASQSVLLDSEEVNSLYHFPLAQMETPNIRWLAAKQSAAPVSLPSDGLVLGQNVYRGQESTVRIKTADRRRHVYIVGTTGSGKSTLMENMIVQDIQQGHGVGVVDPHGGLIDAILPCIPAERMHDVIVFNPADIGRPIGLNMLEANSPEERDAAVQEMIAIFMKLFPPEMIGPMFEHNMRNAMLTLMEDDETPGTIADIPRIFTDKAFQQYKVRQVKDPVVRAFWEKEMAKTSDFHKSEMLGYLISKVGRFVENAQMRNIIGQPKSGFNLRDIMDKKKILLVNLSKGKIGEVNASLLGLIIVSKLQMAALSRADIAESARQDFFLYIDEFQNFITDSIATILSEARKYKLDLTMAHQYMGQLVQNNDSRVRDAVLGNVGTMIAFRIGVEDAEILEKQFAPTFSAYDLVNQEQYTAYIRLMIDNTVAPPFHLQTFPPGQGNPEVAKAIIDFSRLRYGKDRRVVEAEILARTKLGTDDVIPPPMTEPRQ
ncbi:MAG: type IV secretory system conjugative DNA transfer family protein [Candidatus Kerfeldbacteria bacterium]|nr:type IV secretory system conjugative DNA transfer family protein [Candidatus Kerfeldbacteria bacterium]